jgi:hypothetical protein
MLISPKSSSSFIMDDQNRRGRTHDTPQYGNPNQRFGSEHDQARGFGEGSSERYRQAPLTASPQAGRGIATPVSSYGYYGEAAATFPTTIPQNPISYQPEFEAQRTQSASFANYPGMMYGVTQTSQNVVYATPPQHFVSRQPASMQMLSDGTPYYSAEAGGTQVAASLQQPQSTTPSTAYQQSPAAQAYPGSMTGMTTSPQGPSEMEEEGPFAEGVINQEYKQFRIDQAQIFQYIVNGMLVEASQLLLKVSTWLLTHIVELGKSSNLLIQDTLLTAISGLTDDGVSDDVALGLWNEFNYAWLGVLQKQKEMTLELLSGAALRPGQSLIPAENIHKMCSELVRLCDEIERHGLAGYQYGVWEEQIIVSKFGHASHHTFDAQAKAT